MKEIITTIVTGLLAWAGICLMVADSDSRALLLLSKVVGVGLFLVAYAVYSKVEKHEESV